MPDVSAERYSADGLVVTRLTARAAALGESPVWDRDARCLWWIDGVAGLIRRHVPGHEEAETTRVGGHLGTVALATGGRLIAARDHDVLLCDPATGEVTILQTLPYADPAMRLNDGKLDRQGRFLCAGMERAGDPLGSLHQIDAEGRHHILATGLAIGNGVSFSPAGDTLYYTDTVARTIFACDYDPVTGDAAGPPLQVATDALGSGVDGMTVDRDGNLWAALVSSGEIACFAPDGIRRHRFSAPVDLPSSLAFGGPEMATLFVTSIRDSGTGRAVSSHPDGGHLFAIHGTGATGIPEARFIVTEKFARNPT